MTKTAIGVTSAVARLMPGGEKICSGRDLAEVLSKGELSAEEAKAWRRDLKTARKALKLPGTPSHCDNLTPNQ
jgi:hypothetical protein